MRIYLYLALHSDTLCAVIYPFSGLLYRTLEFCTSECRLDNTRRHLHVSRGYTHLVCLALRVRYVCYTLAEGYIAGTKKVGGGGGQTIRYFHLSCKHKYAEALL